MQYRTYIHTYIHQTVYCCGIYHYMYGDNYYIFILKHTVCK